MGEVLFGEASERAARSTRRTRCRTCAACRDEFTALEGTIELSRMRSHQEPGEAFWDGFHDRVIGRVLDEASAPTNVLPLVSDRDLVGRRSGGGLRLLSPLTSRLVAAIVLIAVGFGIGKLASVPAPSGSQLADQGDQSDIRSSS